MARWYSNLGSPQSQGCTLLDLFVMVSLCMRLLLALFALSLIAQAAGPLRVVALHPVLAELAENLGEKDVTVGRLIPAGVDPHTFNPAPSAAKAIHEADLVIASGFSLEPYLDKLVANSGSKARLFTASSCIREVVKSSCACSHQGEHSHEGHDHGEIDPHWWHSIANIVHVAEGIAGELSTLRPEQASLIAQRLASFRSRMEALSRWALAEMEQLPPNSRILVTSHDAFGYLARDYGFAVHPLHGVSPEAEPDAKALARLIDLIRKLGVKAVFVDSTENPKLLSAMMRESGAKMGGVLYADGPGGEGTPAQDIESMFRHNLGTIVRALK